MGLVNSGKWLSFAILSLIILSLAGNAAAQEDAKITAELKIGDSFTAGQKVEADILVKMIKGFHVNCNADQQPAGMPLCVTIESDGALALGEVKYPKATMIKMASVDESVPVFENEVVFKLTLNVAPDAAKGKHKAMLIMEYQGCDENTCHMPELMEMPFEYEIK